jgi:uncharacterized protein YdeI (BOF family)
MRAVVKVMFKGEDAKKMISLKSLLENNYGLTVSTSGKVVKGLAEDIDEAGRVYNEIERAVYNGDTEYI